MSHHPTFPPELHASTASMALRLRRSLALLLAAVALAATVASAIQLVKMRDDALARASERAADTARLLEEHFTRVFSTADFIIERAAADLAHRPPNADTWGHLVTLAAGLPERGNLGIVDAAGNLVMTSATFPMPPIDVTDRLFFRAHRDGAQVFIGPMIPARTNGRAVFTISRRVNGADGSFEGIVNAAIDADYFGGFFNALALGSHGNTVIVDLSGNLILRQPHPEGWEGRSVAGGAVLDAAQRAPIGIVRGRSPLDGIERIFAYRSLPATGVIVGAGIAVSDALAAWRGTAAMVGAGLGAFALVLGALATVTYRGLKREQAMMLGLELTVQERTEEARRQADEAQRANYTKTRFLAAASHDLRQPLQAAGMFAEVLAVRLENSDHEPVVDKLRQAIDATGTLLNTLLDVSTLESGKVEAQVVAFPPQRLLDALTGQMAPEAASRKLRLRMVPTSAWIQSDPVLLERIIRNLMVNALRYTQSGGVVIGCRRRGDKLAIQVADTGIGIPGDKLGVIFDDFTRLHDASRFGHGPGLGLGVVRRMAQMLDHRVEVRSTVGRGSVFSVLVPLAAGPR